MTFAAIIPALNEAQTIGSVVAVLRGAHELSEIIVIDDGSTDDTAQAAAASGVRVIRLPQNTGKGAAMRFGAKQTKADIIIFFDADLVGIHKDHITALTKPFVQKKELGMVIGLRDRYNGFTNILKHFFPFFVLSGERAIQRDLFLSCSKDTSDFGIEVRMNAYCATHHIPVEYVHLAGLDQIIKEKKYGLLVGFYARLRMICQIVHACILMILNK